MMLPSRRVLNAALIGLVVAVAIGSLVFQWDDVTRSAVQIDPLLVGAGLAAAAASLGTSGLAWRHLLVQPSNKGTHLAFFWFSQMGKYLPGGFGPAVVQASLAKDLGISRTAAAQAYLVFAGVTVATGTALAAATLPFTRPDLFADYWWVNLGLLAVVPVLHPRLLARIMEFGLARIGRPSTITPLSARQLAAATSWTLATWLLLGAHTFALSTSFADPSSRLLLLGIGGYCLAWTAGFVVLFLPAGLGAREVILVAALSTQLDVADATAVAVLSRIVGTLADVLVGLIAGWRLGTGVKG